MKSLCPPSAKLVDWLEGRLQGPPSQQVAEHLRQCQACEDLLEVYKRSLPDDPVQYRRRNLAEAEPDETQGYIAPIVKSPLVESALVGGYELARILGSGGMGEVWLARDTRIGRLVALKSPRFTDEQLRRRFVQEAKAVGKLQHPQICSVYDVFEHDGMPYMVMEYIEGETLDSWARSQRSPREVAEVVAKIARAAAYAHDHQVIHRDLKPSNVLVDGASQPHLMDFGLAKILHDDAHDLTLTRQILGTPAYMAPEQARGDNEAVDARTDVYAIGTMLYRLLSGRPPLWARAFCGASKKKRRSPCVSSTRPSRATWRPSAKRRWPNCRQIAIPPRMR